MNCWLYHHNARIHPQPTVHPVSNFCRVRSVMAPHQRKQPRTHHQESSSSKDAETPHAASPVRFSKFERRTYVVPASEPAPVHWAVGSCIDPLTAGIRRPTRDPATLRSFTDRVFQHVCTRGLYVCNHVRYEDPRVVPMWRVWWVPAR